jgi:hypothetical protein
MGLQVEGRRWRKKRYKNRLVVKGFSQKNFYLETALYLGGFLAHGFFVDGFLFSVKELGFWTNPGHWVRVLDVVGSYMYFVL